MQFIELERHLRDWSTEGVLWRCYPSIANGRLLGFVDAQGELVSFEGDASQAHRLLRNYNFAVSNYWARQLPPGDLPKKSYGATLRPEFRRSPARRSISDSEVAEYKDFLASLAPGKVGEVAYLENRQRVLRALQLAADGLGMQIKFLPGAKGVVHVTVAPKVTQ